MESEQEYPRWIELNGVIGGADPLRGHTSYKVNSAMEELQTRTAHAKFIARDCRRYEELMCGIGFFI